MKSLVHVPQVTHTHTHTHTPHLLYPFIFVEGHMSSFHSLAIVDIAAMNIGVQVPFQITPTFVG